MNWLGIDKTQYWILVRLFRTLSDRMELTGQLGMDRKAMGTVQIWNLIFGGLLSLIAFIGRIPGTAYLTICLAATAFMLVPTLVSEAANAFMNPAEVFVLAHQPIRGRTFIAAKSTYLLLTTGRVVLSLNALPALAGLRLKDTSLIYPFTHLLSASVSGLFIALLMCGLFGILFRIIPISRLRNAARWMQLLLAVIFPLTIRFGQFLPVRKLLPANLNFSNAIWSAFPPTWFIALGLAGQPGRPPFSIAYALPVMIATVLFIGYGARSLSQDYMTRVVMMMRGERTRRRVSTPRDWMGSLVRRLTGQPSGRAAYAFVSKMALRDWQFRRFALQGIFPFAFILFRAIMAGNTTRSPFQLGFSLAHLVPHLLGYVLMIVCAVMTVSDQYKAAWIFLTVPMGGISAFVRGIYWSLWLPFSAVPHVFVLAVGVWFWGPLDALIFTAYSLAMTSLYLAATLKLLEGIPFATAPKARTRGAVGLSLMLGGFVIGGMFVGLQYFFIFRNMGVTLIVTMLAGAGAVLLAKQTLREVETNVMHNLRVIASGRARMFRELEAE